MVQNLGIRSTLGVVRVKRLNRDFFHRFLHDFLLDCRRQNCLHVAKVRKTYISNSDVSDYDKVG